MKKSPRTQLPASFRRPGTARASLAWNISAALLAPLAATAAEQRADADPVAVMGVTKVQAAPIDPNPNAEPGVPYKARTSGDERLTRPLAEVPFNMSVLTKAQIDDSGYTDLREILDAQPGITLGTGENGNAFGDRYIIRGQEARSDVFVDGLRDPGMTIRESFAVEQVEISKGPNSSFAGRGTAGGAVNAITKQATRDFDFSKVSTAFGSDDHVRLTLDTNRVFGEQLAMRANVLYADGEVPDRAPAERQRKGLALSTLFTPNDRFDLVLDYYGLRADDKPDLGYFLTGTLPDRRPVEDAPVYLQDQDFFEADVDTATLRLRYRFGPDMRITNSTRYGTTDNAYVVTGAGAATTNANGPAGAYPTVTLSTHNRWQEVEYLVNRTNLHLERTLGGMKHELIFGLEYADHSVLNGIFDITNSGQNCMTGNATAPNAWCATQPDGRVVNGLNSLMNRQIAQGRWTVDWNVDTISAYVMDTVDLTDRLTAFGGVRWDRFEFDTISQAVDSTQTRYEYSDSLFNGHVGLTYALTPSGMVYASFATSSDINGGESDVGTNCGYGGICVDVANGVGIADSQPEKSRLIELGTKWHLADERLLLTAALFQIEKTDVMEATPNTAGYAPTGSQNTGANRVRGIEVGIIGQIAQQLTVQAGATFMDAEVRKSNVPTNVGLTLSNFADESAFAQLKYQPLEPLSLGATVRYESEKFGGQPDSPAGRDIAADAYSQPVPSYVVYDVFGSYRFNRNLDLRVNVGNVTDKDYYTAVYRSGRFLYKGDGRTFRVTLNYDF